MWYAVWTSTGSEQKLCSWITEFVSHDLYEVVFVPMIEKNLKIKGEWKTIQKPLFPGYMFVETDGKRIVELYKKLKQSEQFSVILSSDGKYSPIGEEETYLIDNAYKNSGILGSSIGVIEGDSIKILSGPLTGLEGAIRSIDRHKRIASIEIIMFGRTSKINIGLEIISKT